MLGWLGRITAAARRRLKAELLAVASIIVVAWLGAWVFVVHQHAAEVEETVVRAETLARLFEENVTGRIKVIDNTLLLFRASEADGMPNMDVRIWSDAVERGAPVFQIALLGPDGRLVSSNLTATPSRLDLSDREHFRFHADTPERDELFISRPIIGRVSGKTSIQFSRRLVDRSGGFGGVVVASVSPAFLTEVRAEIGEANATFALIGRDGEMRALAPNPAPAWATRGAPALAEAVALATQATLTPSASDRSVTAVRRLHDLGLIVAVSLQEERPSSSLSHSRRSAAGGAAAVSLLAIAGGIALAQRRQRLEMSQRILVASRKALSDAMQNVSQGILLLDDEGRVLVANGQTARLLGVPRETLEGMPNLVDVTLAQYRAGEFGDRFASEEDVVDYIRGEWANLTRTHVYERVRSDGTVLEVRTNPLPDGGGCVRTYTDVTDRKAAEERARHLALHDTLTGLPNRALINERLTAATGRGAYALLFVDLDRFKLVNDLYGHDAGDKLLVDVAARLREVVRPGDTIARLGGDEFTVMLPNATPAAAGAVARRIVALLSEPFEVAGRAFSIGASVGIAMHPEHGASGTAMMAAADTAMYEAKCSGRGTYAIYDVAMARGVEEQKNLESDLRVAVAERQFRLVFQPVRRTDTSEVTGFEALIRWHHPDRGVVSPHPIHSCRGAKWPHPADRGMGAGSGLCRSCSMGRRTVRRGQHVPAAIPTAGSLHAGCRCTPQDRFIGEPSRN